MYLYFIAIEHPRRRGRVRIAGRRRDAVPEAGAAARRLDSLSRLRSLHRRVGSARFAAQRRSRTSSSFPCLVMTFMLGPIGLLFYFAIRTVETRALAGACMFSELRHRDPLLFWIGAAMMLDLHRLRADLDRRHAADPRPQSVDQADEVPDLDHDLPLDRRLVHAGDVRPGRRGFSTTSSAGPSASAMVIEIACIILQSARGTHVALQPAERRSTSPSSASWA